MPVAGYSGREGGVSPAVSSILLMLTSTCPDCVSGRIARIFVLSESFWIHVGYAILPFILAGLVVYHFVKHLDRSDRNDRNDPDNRTGHHADHSDG